MSAELHELAAAAAERPHRAKEGDDHRGVVPHVTEHRGSALGAGARPEAPAEERPDDERHGDGRGEVLEEEVLHDAKAPLRRGEPVPLRHHAAEGAVDGGALAVHPAVERDRLAVPEQARVEGAVCRLEARQALEQLPKRRRKGRRGSTHAQNVARKGNGVRVGAHVSLQTVGVERSVHSRDDPLLHEVPEPVAESGHVLAHALLRAVHAPVHLVELVVDHAGEVAPVKPFGEQSAPSQLCALDDAADRGLHS
mmetsp:Transcript_38388/g.91040  ORF Transcript_38388/g.91040 Transcript_38388/m.91040 type:complete len:253 (-) Transcript_38388:557-1315(-)